MEPKLSIAPHVAFWEDQNSAVDDISIYVADLLSSEIFEFRGSAAIVWSILADGLNRIETIQEVAKVYGEQETTISAGVVSFIDCLLKQNILIEIKE